MREWTVGNHATVSMLWRSTTQTKIPGEMDLLSPVPSFHCAPMLQMQEWSGGRFMCVDTTTEQVRKNLYLLYLTDVEHDDPLFLLSQIVMMV